MNDLKLHLDAGWEAFRTARSLVKDREPDSVQVELYELAFSYAELLASEQLVQFASNTDGAIADQKIKQLLARNYLASSLQDLLNRLCLFYEQSEGRSALDLGVATERFIFHAISTRNLSATGLEISNRNGKLPASELETELETMRQTVRKFADEVVAPLAGDIHREDKMIPDVILQGVRDLGCFALSVPERYGGLKPDQGENSVGMVVVTEELSRGSLGAAGSLITRPEIMVRALLEGGTEEQRQRWLPSIGSGEQLCAVSVTEPDTGSDVAAVKLRATKSDHGWVLNGAKTWCTFAGKAELILVLARTEPEVSPPHRGLSLFVIEKPSFDGQTFEVKSEGGGTLTGSAIPTLGYRGMHSFALFFDEFCVPSSNLVGETEGTNRGFYYTMRGFSGGRLQTAARAVGLMEAAYEAAYTYANERKVFGRPVGDFQLTRVKLARMASYIIAVRQFAYHVAGLMDLDQGQLEASLVKLIACKYAEWVTREALQIHGGMGYAEETAVSRYFVDARVLSIFEGAEETLALRVIGKALQEMD